MGLPFGGQLEGMARLAGQCSRNFDLIQDKNLKGVTMENNLLNFAPRKEPSLVQGPCAVSAEIISISDYRKTARRLRTPTGVYFISRTSPCGDDLSAA